MADTSRGIQFGFIRGMVGAAVGGAIGYFAFLGLLNYHLYAGVLPGVLVGFGFGLFSGQRSLIYGFLCGLLALALGLFIEWKFFDNKENLLHIITHIQDIKFYHLIHYGLGSLGSLWFGIGWWRRKKKK